MMRTRILWSLAALVAFGVASFAEGESKEKPKAAFGWEVKGKVAEELEFRFVQRVKVDQSSPRAAVKTLIAYTEWDAVNDEAERVADIVEAAIRRSMEAWEEKLLTEEVREDLKKTREKNEGSEDGEEGAEEDGEDQDFSHTRGELGIKDETVLEDGRVRIEAHRTSVTRRPNWETGEIETVEDIEKHRFYLVKAEGEKWKIAQTQQYQRDWMSEEMDAYVWQDNHGMLSLLHMLAIEDKEKKAAVLKQDTPEAAAMSLFQGLFARKSEIETLVFQRAFSNLIGLIESLHTESYIAKSKAEAGEQGRGWGADDNEREIDTVTDGEGGVKIVKFKPRNEWVPAPVEIRVRKEGDVWKVVEGGYYQIDWDEDNEETFTYQKESDIYRLSMR